MSNQSKYEWLAALQDDALHEWPKDQTFDEQALLQWQRQVQASAALRGEFIPTASSTERLLSAVRDAQKQSPKHASLNTEPTLAIDPGIGKAPSHDATLHLRPAANHGRFAWPWAAAVMLAVGLWTLLPALDQSEAERLAQGSGQPLTTLNAQPAVPAGEWITAEGVLRDPHLDALLQSHRQWGGGAGLAFPAGYVRNVALER